MYVFWNFMLPWGKLRDVTACSPCHTVPANKLNLLLSAQRLVWSNSLVTQHYIHNTGLRSFLVFVSTAQRTQGKQRQRKRHLLPSVTLGHASVEDILGGPLAALRTTLVHPVPHNGASPPWQPTVKV